MSLFTQAWFWAAIGAGCAVVTLLWRIAYLLMQIQSKLDSKLSVDQHAVICEQHDLDLKESLKEIKESLKETKTTLAEQDKLAGEWREKVGTSLHAVQLDVAVLKAISKQQPTSVFVNSGQQ